MGTAQMVGGPYDGALYAVEQDAWNAGRLEYSELQPPAGQVSADDAPQIRSSYYRQHRVHHNVWLHESLLNETENN